MKLDSSILQGALPLHYVEGPAAGPTLILWHGLARNSRDFEGLLPRLASRFHVVVPDHRGHGRSPRIAGGYHVQDYVHDALTLVDQRPQWSPLWLYGHSLGGMVALAAAAARPERVLGVMLEDPPFHTMGARIASTPYLMQFCGMQEVARSRGDLASRTQQLGEVRVPHASGHGTVRLADIREPAALRFGAECLAMTDPDVFAPVISGEWLKEYDERELFRRLQCPVLILQGDPSVGGALTDADAEIAEASACCCRRVRFSDCGHMMHWQQPRRVLELIESFVDSTAKEGPCTASVTAAEFELPSSNALSPKPINKNYEENIHHQSHVGGQPQHQPRWGPGRGRSE